jgi:peptidoglycan/LPS O-acetylase OafA/YrhL
VHTARPTISHSPSASFDEITRGLTERGSDTSGTDEAVSRRQPVEARPATSRHRAVDGLRAIAILVVVANHADIPGFSRGFVGVDVFFVISGYLITKRFAGPTLDQTQTLREFWAGRARRIMPAVALTTAGTALIATVVFAPFEFQEVRDYGIASVLFGVNVLAPLRGGDYFAAGLRESPYLHLWSLGLEEQFYLFWPLFVALLLRAVRHRSFALRRRSCGAVLGAVCIASLGASVVLTAQSPLWAFYSLPSRIYEFGAGALLGLAVIPAWRTMREAQLAVTAGAALIVAALIATPVDAGFPGAWPLLAVFGSALIIHGADPRHSWSGTFRRGLESNGARRISECSYAWRLVHWPVLVLVTAATRSSEMGAVASIAAVFPAYLMYRFVEDPIRGNRRLTRSWRLSLAAGAMALGLAACSISAASSVARWRLSRPADAAYAAAENGFIVAGCRDAVVHGIKACVGGSPTRGAPTVLLVGDSHAGQWMAAFSDVGRRKGFRVILRWYGNCGSVPFSGDRANLGPHDHACAAFAEESIKLLDRSDVRAVVFTEADSSRLSYGPTTVWTDAAIQFAEQVRARGISVGRIIDNPRSYDANRCLARGFPESACAVSRAAALELNRAYDGIERRISSHLDAVLDLTTVICSADPCPTRLRGALVASRANHLNRAFTLTLEGDLEPFTAELIHRTG